jgi:two-component system cell cycle sensor histidine kinase/response regulator CckA
VRFKYQLEGYDRDWIDAGNRRDAFYNNLPPGRYRFRVVAANNDGVWNDTGATFALQLRPHFYQTYLFFGGCVTLVLATGIGWHLARLRRLRQRSEELSLLVVERTEANRRLQGQITERQAAEHALRASEERYRRFFEEDLAGAFIVAPSGRILDCNPAFARMFGYGSPAEAIGRESLTFYRTASERTALMARLQRERHVHDHILHLRRHDGTAVDVIANMNVILDERGEIAETHGYFIDITERNRLEAQLRQSQKMDAVGQLAGGIAHDFNNLLTAIICHSELLASEPGLPPKIAAGIREIRNAGDLAAALTRQLLAFSRRQILQARVLDLNVLFAELQKLLRRLIGENIVLEIRPASHPAWVEADPGQIEQVVLNLVINARDAMPQGGRVTVSIEHVLSNAALPAASALSTGSVIKLSVCDTGKGMTPDVLAHIFEPFFTTKPIGQGTGLGLSTVYGIVRQSQGHIEVKSTPGVGSTFDIFLPQVSEPKLDEAADETPPPLTRSKTILVVEDSEPVRKITAQTLRRHGYTVLIASSAAEAIRFCELRAPPVDLVLTDVVMPELSGIDLAKALALKQPGLRFLFMSGYMDDAIARSGLESSGRFLKKPFTAHALLRKIHEVLHP